MWTRTSEFLRINLLIICSNKAVFIEGRKLSDFMDILSLQLDLFNYFCFLMQQGRSNFHLYRNRKASVQANLRLWCEGIWDGTISWGTLCLSKIPWFLLEKCFSFIRVSRCKFVRFHLSNTKLLNFVWANHLLECCFVTIDRYLKSRSEDFRIISRFHRMNWQYCKIDYWQSWLFLETVAKFIREYS